MMTLIFGTMQERTEWTKIQYVRGAKCLVFIAYPAHHYKSNVYHAFGQSTVQCVSITVRMYLYLSYGIYV